jgi:hypothetical protein
MTPSPQALWVVGDHLEGSAPIPRRGVQAIVAMLQVHRPAGWELTMDAAMKSADPAAQQAAIANPAWMGEERFEAEYRRLTERASDPATDPVERGRLRCCLISSLADTSHGVGRALLLESFEAGHWRTLDGPGSWAATTDPRTRSRILGRLSEGDRRSLIERGLAPAGLFR